MREWFSEELTRGVDCVIPSAFKVLGTQVVAAISVISRVLDATGRVAATKVVTTTEGQWLWDTRTVPSGLYLYELRSQDELFSQGKLAVE